MNTYNYFLRSKLNGASLVKFGLDTNVSRHVAMRTFVYFGKKLAQLAWNGGSLQLMILFKDNSRRKSVT
jgi:hypothetical protein